MGETHHDAVVVGGGISGLSAAWTLRDRDVLVLEADDRLGGRLYSQPFGEYWVNFGGHLFPPPGSVVDSIVRDLGMATVPVEGGMSGMALGDRILTHGRVEAYPARLPLSGAERIAFARAGAKLQLGVKRYQRAARQRRGEDEAGRRRRLFEFEDERTFADFLGPLPPRVERIFSALSNRATAEPAQLSAACGIHLFVMVWQGRDSLIAFNLKGGPGALFAALGERLGDRVRTGARVTGLAPARSGAAAGAVEVTYRDGAVAVTASADQVIVAVPPPAAAPLLRGLAPETAVPLDGVPTGPFVSLGIRTTERGPMPWDDVAAAAPRGFPSSRTARCATASSPTSTTSFPRHAGSSARPTCSAGRSATSTRGRGGGRSSRASKRARSGPAATSTWRATTSPTSARWRPPRDRVWRRLGRSRQRAIWPPTLHILRVEAAGRGPVACKHEEGSLPLRRLPRS